MFYDGDVCHCKKSSTTITTLWTARLKENDSMCDGRGTHNLIISSVSVPNCSNNILAESNRKENHENISENSTFTLDCKAKKENLVVNSSNEPEVKTGSSKLKEFDISSSGFRGCKQFPRSCDNEFNNSKITLFNDSTVTNGCGGLDGSHSDAVKIRKESDVRVKHISFDCPNTNKREYALKPCPSLDSSFAHSSIHLKEKNVGVYCKNSPFLDPCGFQPLSQPCPPYTPSTPASGLTSEASFDSGVISSHSFEFPQNVAVDVSDKRKRTASSVSSGIGDIWQSSLDGDICRENSMDVAPFDKNATPLSSSQSINGNNCSTKCKNSVFEATCENPDDNDGEIRKHEVNFPLGVKPSGALHSAHSSQTDHFNVLSESASDSHNASPLSVIFPVASEENLVPAVTAALDDTTKLASPRRSSTKSKGGMIEGGSLSAPRTVSSSFELKEKLDKFAMNLVMIVLNEAFTQSSSLGWSIKCSGQCNQELCKEDYKKKNSHRRRREKEIEKSLFSTLGFSSCSSSLCWTPELPFSPSHRTYSRASKRSSLSFSHDSLVVCTPCQDDSHLIKGAVSHDVLVFPTIKKAEIKKGKGAVCLEDDIYSLPVDVVKPYQGPILQPKVIVHQPKTRHSNRTISKKIDGQEAEQAVVTKRNINNNNSINNNNNNFKERGTRYTKQKGKTGNPNDDCSTNKRNSSLIPVENSHESIDDIEATTTIKESFTTTKPLERTKNRYRKEVKCYEQGKLCRIIPFTSTKGQKRKDNSDMKSDKKKTRSLSSNIRNTLVTFFSFKKSQKEPSNFINAENEFIDASAQELFESTDGMKWGKICPLPSAPPLKTSLKYSAFTDKIESVKAQSTTSKQPNSIAKDSLAADSSKCVNGNPPHNITNQQRQSNSISPSSLLSCLGHPRTNSIGENEHRQRTRRTSEEAKVSALSTVTKRALPPLPQAKGKWEVPVGEPKGPDWKPHLHNKLDEGCDFASIIEKVKNYGWYWGPISGLAAEKVLSNEPDGSFIVRDSSDYHYIFSLTFRLNGVTRHVRIEHDQGNFSFGGFTRFKSQTIVDFIEKAVEHSRSGRYLFFLHRRPVLGPMRVQLLHPVSRFKHVQSLQHLCRFVIVKQVRKDLLHDLPLPQRLKDYLNSPHYYSEQVEQCMSSSAVSLEGATANEDVHQNLSPFLRRHSPPSLQTHRRNTSSLTSTESSHGGCSNHVSLQEPVLAVKPTNSKFSFGDPSTSFVLPKCYKSRENRLSSSHSSLENSLLQMYPISPSTISSESNSGRRPRSRSRNAAFSLRPKAAFFYGSSHSSPSSPVPFDYSPDWLSSSDDFPFLAAASKPLEEQNLGASAHPQHISIKFPSENEQLKNCGTQRSCGLSASSTSQCVSDAFTVDECRHIPNNQVLQSPSTNDVDDGVKILGAQSTALCPELKCESSEELCRSSSSLVHKPNSN